MFVTKSVSKPCECPNEKCTTNKKESGSHVPVTFINVESFKGPTDLLRLYLFPKLPDFSADVRTRIDTWLGNYTHWCPAIDNAWKSIGQVAIIEIVITSGILIWKNFWKCLTLCHPSFLFVKTKLCRKEARCIEINN